MGWDRGGFGCCGVGQGWAWVLWGGTGVGLGARLLSLEAFIHAAGFFITGMAWEEQGNDDGYLLTMESLSREKRRGSDCNVAEESINISD